MSPLTHAQSPCARGICFDVTSWKARLEVFPATRNRPIVSLMKQGGEFRSPPKTKTPSADRRARSNTVLKARLRVRSVNLPQLFESQRCMLNIEMDLSTGAERHRTTNSMKCRDPESSKHCKHGSWGMCCALCATGSLWPSVAHRSATACLGNARSDHTYPLSPPRRGELAGQHRPQGEPSVWKLWCNQYLS